MMTDDSLDYEIFDQKSVGKVCQIGHKVNSH